MGKRKQFVLNWVLHTYGRYNLWISTTFIRYDSFQIYKIYRAINTASVEIGFISNEESIFISLCLIYIYQYSLKLFWLSFDSMKKLSLQHIDTTKARHVSRVIYSHVSYNQSVSIYFHICWGSLRKNIRNRSQFKFR